MTAFVTDIVPADLPEAPRARPRVVLIGTALSIAAIAAMFVGLFAVYFTMRSDTIAGGGDWVPGGAGTIPLAPASVMFVTLVMTSITVHWAVWAISRDDRANTWLALGLTLMLSAAFLNQAAFLYGQMGWEIAGDLAVQAVLIYAITGAQILMLVVAMVFLALMAVRAMAGGYSSRDSEGLVAASLFWHAAVVAYAVVWTAIYQIK
ncbi:MAG: cytochrome c oxidase subunit 3 [Acidimicrobiales bacterium]|nr:cytochrome c oxidase subunit 3 [Acidimicrobiales bacterium]